MAGKPDSVCLHYAVLIHMLHHDISRQKANKFIFHKMISKSMFFYQINAQHQIRVELVRGIAIVMKSVLASLNVEITTVLLMVLKFHQQLIVVMIHQQAQQQQLQQQQQQQQQQQHQLQQQLQLQQQ